MHVDTPGKGTRCAGHVAAGKKQNGDVREAACIAVGIGSGDLSLLRQGQRDWLVLTKAHRREASTLQSGMETPSVSIKV